MERVGAGERPPRIEGAGTLPPERVCRQGVEAGMADAGRARARVWAPLLAVGAAAWLALAVRPDAGHHGSLHSPAWAPAPLAGEAALMFAAMMLPLAGGPLGHVLDRSFAGRRPRAVALFLAGYALPWIAAGAVLLAAGRWIVAAESAAVTALAVAAVALCQCSPLKQRCLNRCHAHPELAASGLGADLGTLRFGLWHAWWCIGSCSALMLLPMLPSRGHLAAMAAVTLWLAGERLARPAPPGWRLRGPGQVVRVALAQARVRLGRPAGA